jgi:DNA polymerase (family 10)
MTNYEIADHFSLLSKLMDIHGENSFKAKSYSVAAYTIEKLPQELAKLSDAELFSIKGIGDAIGNKIKELLTTGKMSALENILMATPPGIIAMLEIKGFGPKKIAVVWKELGIESIGELEYACNENRLAALKGFGAKTQENILKSIAFIQQNQGFHLWAETEAFANGIVQQLQKAFSANQFALTGDIRRQMPTLAYVEILTDLPEAALRSQFEAIPEIVIKPAADMLFIHIPNQPALQFHLHSTAAFHHALFTTTASPEFLAAFKEQYALPETPGSEAEIFTQNNLQFIPPALREGPAVLQTAANNALPALITATDIKGIIHSHSTWSDGLNTIEEMARAAMQQGFEYLVLSDHSQAAFYANGLTPDRIAAQHQEIDALNEKLKPFRIFKSIEADILNDGSLDYNESVLATFDLVIASVHSNLKMSEEKAMDRVLKAVENPFTSILGHPTGRLLLSREGYPLDHKKIIDACAANNVVVEINAHPRRLDLDWKWIGYALEKGVLLSVDPDAHSIAGFHDVYYGAMAAQKGGLTASGNLSSYNLQQIEVFIAAQKEKRSIAAGII